jgi:hypothetical protein
MKALKPRHLAHVDSRSKLEALRSQYRCAPGTCNNSRSIGVRPVRRPYSVDGASVRKSLRPNFHALCRELNQTLLEVERLANALDTLPEADSLVAEAQTLLMNLESETDGYDGQRRS